MYVFSYSVSPAATNDREEWRLLPTVVFQEFSNEERCKAAKSKLEDSLTMARIVHFHRGVVGWFFESCSIYSTSSWPSR
jgi:hypothetical protein